MLNVYIDERMSKFKGEIMLLPSMHTIGLTTEEVAAKDRSAGFKTRYTDQSYCIDLSLQNYHKMIYVHGL